jgi:Photosystem II complex subunit Ycf12
LGISTARATIILIRSLIIRSFSKNIKTVMEIFDTLNTTLAGINFQLIFQLVCLALVVISGPVVIFLLAAKGGDL